MRPRAVARVAVQIILLAAVVCASYRLVSDDKRNAPAADRIEQRLTNERGLKFTRDVPIATVSSAEARGLLERQVRREYTTAVLATTSRGEGVDGGFSTRRTAELLRIRIDQDPSHAVFADWNRCAETR